MARSQAERAAGEAVELFDKTKSLAKDAIKRSKSIYSSASERLPEGSPQVIGWVSAGLLIGVAGFLIGKSAGKKEEPLAEIGQKLDFSPVFKFLKLWMLYRAAL